MNDHRTPSPLAALSRRTLLKAATTAPLALLGCRTTGVSLNRPTDVHVRTATSLALIHQALRRGLTQISAVVLRDEDVVLEDFADYVTLYVDLLDHHHRTEDDILFPSLREAGTLRSTDVAFLEARVTEHVEVHRLVEAIAAWTGTLRSQGRAALPELGHLAAEMEGYLTPHLAEEELGLTAERLAEMITAPALAETQRRISGSQGSPESMMLIAHALDPEEQRAMFGGLPAHVREVLIPTQWAPSYERFLPFSHVQALSL